jgi:uncharacterized protein GlcG (DUF336 family)
MLKSLALATIAAALLAPQHAHAQAPATPPASPAAPAPIPDAMPFDIPYGAPINLEQAHKAIAAAAADAQKRNWKMAIAVVDPSGNLIAHATLDNTQYASIAISQAKARTAAMLRRSTLLLANAVNSGSPATLSLLGLFAGAASEGGLPIVVDGKLIGAIGVSGGTGGQDGVIAKVGMDALTAK